MKLNSNSWLDEIVNKLEDFYIFSIPQEITYNDGDRIISKAQAPNDTEPPKDPRQPKDPLQPQDPHKLAAPPQQANSKTVQEVSLANKPYELCYLPEKGFYYNTATNFKCSYQCESDTSYEADMLFQKGQPGHPTSYMKLITFFCNTSNSLGFLQWFNSIEVQGRLYDFNSIKIIRNGLFPIFQVEQYSSLLSNKIKYYMVRQI